uniref:Candidate secreted effector n=1 Tax=Meloidogyne incognita TaxID=6306 RepID=A0A914MVF1_MELIC
MPGTHQSKPVTFHVPVTCHFSCTCTLSHINHNLSLFMYLVNQILTLTTLGAATTCLVQGTSTRNCWCGRWKPPTPFGFPLSCRISRTTTCTCTRYKYMEFLVWEVETSHTLWFP